MKTSSDNPRYLLLFIITSMLIGGCLGSDEDNSNKGPNTTLFHDTFETQGQVETLAQASPTTVTEEIHFEIPDSNITRIRINISIEDGDPETDTDHIDQIRMWRENGGEPTDIQQAQGDDTPYHTSIEFVYNGDENLVTWWIVEVTATCLAGEDTWLGPLIWYGVSDNGVTYQISADYDHLGETGSV